MAILATKNGKKSKSNEEKSSNLGDNMASKTVGIVFTVISVISLLVALICFIMYLDIQSDYNKYCTGIVGAFARIGDGGQSCEDAKFYLFILTLSWIIFGALGLILGILGIVQINNDHFESRKMIFVKNGVQNNIDYQNIQGMRQIKMSQEQFQKYVENVKPPD